MIPDFRGRDSICRAYYRWRAWREVRAFERGQRSRRS